jgi:hypothetical protein
VLCLHQTGEWLEHLVIVGVVQKHPGGSHEGLCLSMHAPHLIPEPVIGICDKICHNDTMGGTWVRQTPVGYQNSVLEPSWNFPGLYGGNLDIDWLGLAHHHIWDQLWG